MGSTYHPLDHIVPACLIACNNAYACMRGHLHSECKRACVALPRLS